jgi:TolB-like protein
MQSHSVSIEPGVQRTHHYRPLEFDVRDHLARLLDSDQFDASARSRAFLAFIVDEVFAGREASLSQAVIANAVFGRHADFDPVLDPIVRVQAGRLRRSLERYYLLTHEPCSIRIELPKGSYAPHFVVPSAADETLVMLEAEAMERHRERPIVVIHSFRAAAVADDSLAVRLTDDLATELCRCGAVRVARQKDIDRLALSRHAAVRFDLRGNLHREVEDERRLAIRLVDRTTGEQVWGDSDRVVPTRATAGMLASRVSAWYCAAAMSLSPKP